MRTRFPKCGKCKSPIDPNKDKFRVTNLEEAKYGRTPLYAHEVCPSHMAESEPGLEEALAGIAIGGPNVVVPGRGEIKLH